MNTRMNSCSVWNYWLPVTAQQMIRSSQESWYFLLGIFHWLWFHQRKNISMFLFPIRTLPSEQNRSGSILNSFFFFTFWGMISFFLRCSPAGYTPNDLDGLSKLCIYVMLFEKLTYIFTGSVNLVMLRAWDEKSKYSRSLKSWAELVLQDAGAQGRNVRASQMNLDSRQHLLDPLDDTWWVWSLS